MATTEDNRITEAAHIRHVRQYNTAVKTLSDDAIDQLIEQGSLQGSTVVEHALAQTGKYNVVSRDGYDFDDLLWSDAKISTTRLRKRHTLYSAPVSSFHAKIGALRVQVWERVHDRFYYFIIPVRTHKLCKHIEIPFNKDGTPNRQPTYQGINWWDYEVPTFERLAQDMMDPVQALAMANTLKLESMFPTVRTGGKVTGVISMTPNAIRKRAARVQQRRSREAQRKARSAE